MDILRVLKIESVNLKVSVKVTFYCFLLDSVLGEWNYKGGVVWYFFHYFTAPLHTI